jgi:hypothetical protein
MSETPKVPPPAGYKSWLDFAAETISGDYFSLDTLPGTKTLVAINWAKRELDDLRADLGDAATYRDAVRSAHNGYYAEMRDAMPELREPESPAAAISDLVQTAEEDGAMQERLRWEPELAALRAERDRLRAALGQIATHADCCGPDCRYCDDDTAHPLSYSAQVAKKALETS